MNAEWHRRVAELDERDAWQALRCRSTVDWLTSTLALTTYEARTAVDVARVLKELTKTAAQFAAGQIDVAAVQAAARAHGELARLAARAAAEREAATEHEAGAHDDDAAGDDAAGGGTHGDSARDSDARGAADGDETETPDADQCDGRHAGGAGDEALDRAREELDRLIQADGVEPSGDAGARRGLAAHDRRALRH